VSIETQLKSKLRAAKGIKGIGVEADLFFAISMYAYAAQEGIEEAIEKFNELYYNGSFLNSDGTKRFFWFENENLAN
jgi:hypothetical protein